MNKRRQTITMLIGVIMMLLAMPVNLNAKTDPLLQELRQARKPSEPIRFQIPPKKQFLMFQAAMEHLMKASKECNEHVFETTKKMLNGIGFEARSIRQHGTTFWLIRESKGIYRGAGVYVIRCGGAAPVVIQAPHGFYDLYTFTIAYRVFLQTQARAFMTNTLHRYKAYPEETASSSLHPADAAHNERLFFQAATIGTQRGNPSLTFIQLHGFGGKTTTVKADMIISTGEKKHSPIVAALARSLRRIGILVLEYWKDTKELGATTNVQAKVLNRNGQRFIHIEMNRKIRERLRKEKKFLSSFSAALMEAISANE